MARNCKTALLSALFLAVVIPSVPAHAGTEGVLSVANRRIAEAKTTRGKDVDTGDARNRSTPEAVLLRANRTPVRTLGGARHPVALRALLCEASFIPFAPVRRRPLLREQPGGGRSPVVVIHFPRPPPFYRWIV